MNLQDAIRFQLFSPLTRSRGLINKGGVEMKTMTPDEFREKLFENESAYLFLLERGEREDIFGEVYEDLDAMWEEFDPDPNAEWREGYLIEVTVDEDEITYTAGLDQQEINNQPPWISHDVDETLEDYLYDIYEYITTTVTKA